MTDPAATTPQTLVVCIDGTWCPARRHAGGVLRDTNVVRLFRLLASSPHQRQFYAPGVGSGGIATKLIGGVWGWGSRALIREAYRFVCHHHRPGDQVALFGFSRGAFAVRAVSAVIDAVGILRQDSLHLAGPAVRIARSASRNRRERQAEFRQAHSFPVPTVCFVGVWDTVTSHGPHIPWVRLALERHGDRHFGLLDMTAPACVRRIAHALALDEARGSFSPWRAEAGLPEQVVEEEWFAGYHSDVGGGNLESRPADIPLAWMIEKAMEAGIRFDAMPAVDAQAHLAPLTPSRTGIWRLLPRRPRTLHADDSIHASVARRVRGSDYKPQARRSR